MKRVVIITGRVVIETETKERAERLIREVEANFEWRKLFGDSVGNVVTGTLDLEIVGIEES